LRTIIRWPWKPPRRRNGCFGPYPAYLVRSTITFTGRVTGGALIARSRRIVSMILDWLAVGLERFDTALRCAEPMTSTGTWSLILWSGNITIQMDTRSLVPFPKDQRRN